MPGLRKMHTFSYDGKKLLEAICFEKDGKEKIGTITSHAGHIGEESIANNVASLAIIENIVNDIKEKRDMSGVVKGYDLGRFLVGEKNALYVSAMPEEDDSPNKILQLFAKGNKHSINKFKKALAEYDKCTLCGAITPYKKSTHINLRVGYIGDGAGQICRSKVCTDKAYGRK